MEKKKEKKSRIKKYVLVRLQVEEENNRGCRQKKRNYELFDIYIYTHTLHIEEFYMNKKYKPNIN